jgi:hypothetical protein
LRGAGIMVMRSECSEPQWVQGTDGDALASTCLTSPYTAHHFRRKRIINHCIVLTHGNLGMPQDSRCRVQCIFRASPCEPFCDIHPMTVLGFGKVGSQVMSATVEADIVKPPSFVIAKSGGLLTFRFRRFHGQHPLETCTVHSSQGLLRCCHAGNGFCKSSRFSDLNMVGDNGLEPSTSTMSTWRSNQTELIAHGGLVYPNRRGAGLSKSTAARAAYFLSAIISNLTLTSGRIGTLRPISLFS